MATQTEKAQAILSSLGVDPSLVEIKGTGARRVAVVSLPNGRSISTNLTDGWEATLEKQVRKFKNKQ